jgi:ELWxxDGT repeat protein
MALSYFVKNVGGGAQFWVSNGTVAGTHMLASIGRFVVAMSAQS